MNQRLTNDVIESIDHTIELLDLMDFLPVYDSIIGQHFISKNYYRGYINKHNQCFPVCKKVVDLSKQEG